LVLLIKLYLLERDLRHHYNRGVNNNFTQGFGDKNYELSEKQKTDIINTLAEYALLNRTKRERMI